MGCGCSKGGKRNTNRPSTVGFGSQSPQRENVVVTPQQNVPATPPSVSPKTQVNNSRPNVLDRRNVEKLRREAIKRALGR